MHLNGAYYRKDAFAKVELRDDDDRVQARSLHGDTTGDALTSRSTLGMEVSWKRTGSGATGEWSGFHDVRVRVFQI